jgi:hypothetical protein
MAITTGPLFSQTARGGFNKTLIFQTYHGRTYAKAWKAPRNDRTPAERGIRAAAFYLSQRWKTLDPTTHALWYDFARAPGISTWNAYFRANMNRWKNELGFADAPTSGPTSNYQYANAPTLIPTATGISVTITTNDPTVIAIAIYRKLSTTPDSDRGDCVAVTPADGSGNATWLDEGQCGNKPYPHVGLAAGEYHYTARALDLVGGISSPSDETIQFFPYIPVGTLFYTGGTKHTQLSDWSSSFSASGILETYLNQLYAGTDMYYLDNNGGDGYDGYFDLSIFPNLQNVYIMNCPLSATPPIGSQPSLTLLDLNTDGLTTTPDISGCPSIQFLNLAANGFTEVDTLLVTLAATTNLANNGICNIDGGTNAAPTATGLAAIATLTTGDGTWAVNTN